MLWTGRSDDEFDRLDAARDEYLAFEHSVQEAAEAGQTLGVEHGMALGSEIAGPVIES